MSTLNVVEEILRERGTPMVVREIVQVSNGRLPTKSKTPDTVVARDLAMDIKRHGDLSKFARVAPGQYTLRELVKHELAVGSTPVVQPVVASQPIAGATVTDVALAEAARVDAVPRDVYTTNA